MCPPSLILHVFASAANSNVIYRRNVFENPAFGGKYRNTTLGPKNLCVLFCSYIQTVHELARQSASQISACCAADCCYCCVYCFCWCCISACTSSGTPPLTRQSASKFVQVGAHFILPRSICCAWMAMALRCLSLGLKLDHSFWPSRCSCTMALVEVQYSDCCHLFEMGLVSAFSFLACFELGVGGVGKLLRFRNLRLERFWFFRIYEWIR